mmetsp:Transcript_27800/g.45851  ORF Transcript_27800/g.45851 Transcript_27800/m.45851 type:complete len:244 (-) Transcript_27800:27-758(-)
MAAMRNEKEAMFLVHGYIRLQIQDTADTMHTKCIPLEIVQLFFRFYHQPFTRLPFSKEYVDEESSYDFTENDQCVTRNSTIRGGMNWIIVDDDPVTSGIHCWRVQTRTKSSWMMWAVCQKKRCQHLSFKEAYGIGVHDGQWYPKPNNAYWPHHNGASKLHFQEQCSDGGEVDMLLNVDDCTLQLCVVGMTASGLVPELTKLPNISNDGGWVLHLSTYASKAQLRVAKIPVEWFGEKRDIFNDS